MTQDQLAESLKRNLIVVSQEELDTLMLDFDTTGAAKAFELSAFETDFAEWQTQEFKD